MSYKLKEVVKNNRNHPIVNKLLQTQFWRNYGLKNQKYIVKDYFPQVEVSDDILVYQITSPQYGSYDLIIPYGKMLHPKFLEQVLEMQSILWNKYSIWLYITDTIRTLEEQLQVNNSSLNVIKGNSPSLSPHNLGLQIDFTPVVINRKNKNVEEWINSRMKDNPAWRVVQETQNSVGLKWGGDFLSYYDPIHVQHPLSYQLTEQIRQNNRQQIQTLINQINNTKIEPFRETNVRNRPNGNIYWI